MTIIELTVVMVIIGVILPVLSVFLISAYRNAFHLSDRVSASSQTSNALWYMDDQIRTSNSFLTAVPGLFSDAYGPHDSGTSGGQAWSYKGDGNMKRVLIVQGNATTTNALGTGRQPVFIETPVFNCTTQIYYQPKLTYISIYYVKDTTLYRRVLTDRTSTLCEGSTQAQKQSCPPYITSGRHSSCQADDEVLATDVYGFTVDYYQINSTSEDVPLDPGYASTDPEVLTTADYVMINITISTNNGVTQNTASQRMTKVNQ